LNADKARVYLERSKSSPINLRLDREGDLPLHDPFLQIVPHAIGRLKSLIVNSTPQNLPAITAHLSRHASLLEHLSINGNYQFKPHRSPILTSMLFDGGLPSLRELRLRFVRTGLPWRNMVNLTSFELHHTKLNRAPIRQLLDFFESTPHLRKVKLLFATPTSGAPNCRLVSLACLKRMSIIGEEPPSLLFNHLIIPVGAELTTEVDSIEDLLPKSLDNLRNLFNFAKIHLCFRPFYSYAQFSGPNGKVRVFIPPRHDPTRLAFEFLARLRST
jgi:hypothetical protein